MPDLYVPSSHRFSRTAVFRPCRRAQGGEVLLGVLDKARRRVITVNRRVIKIVAANDDFWPKKISPRFISFRRSLCFCGVGGGGVGAIFRIAKFAIVNIVLYLGC